MLVETVLNRGWHHKGFVYEGSRFEGESLVVSVRPRKRSRGHCGRCGKAGPTYDHEPGARWFEHVPLWGWGVYLEYRMRRIACAACGRVVVEAVPWATGKHHTTDIYRCFLASWAKVISWQEVSRRFHACWQTVFRSVQYVVGYGLQHRDLSGVSALGIDELAWRKGHEYGTAVYQIDPHHQRLLWVGKDRREQSLKTFFLEREKKAEGFAGRIRVVCSDLWRAHVKVIGQVLPQAVPVIDRFHIM